MELPDKFKDTPYDELPPEYKREAYREDPSVDDTPHPAAQPMDEGAAAALEELPPGTTFPHHKGGGWYLLSDGSTVQGEEDATKQQDALNAQ